MRVVIYLVPDNRKDIREAVDAKMAKREFLKVAEGFEELQVRVGDELVLESAVCPNLPRHRTWGGRPLPFECTISALNAEPSAVFSLRNLSSHPNQV